MRPCCGDIGGLLAVICRLKDTQDCMVDQVESEPFSTPEFRQQTQFGSELVQSSIPVMRTEYVTERIGDYALIEGLRSARGNRVRGSNPFRGHSSCELC